MSHWSNEPLVKLPGSVVNPILVANWAVANLYLDVENYVIF